MKTTHKVMMIAVGILALAVPAATPLDAKEQITRAGSVLLRSGFDLVRTVDGWLDQGDVDEYSLWLQGGVEHAFSGRCDGDCSDLDLRLVNRAGTVVTRSTDASDFPAIRFTPASSGTYRLEVIMYRCSVEPCGYEVEQFSR